MVKLYAHYTMQSILNLASSLADQTLKILRVWSKQPIQFSDAVFVLLRISKPCTNL